MSRRIIQRLIVLHRWLGIVLCLFMLAWFASGIVLIYVPFPSLDESERIARQSNVYVSAVQIAPGTATAGLQADSTIEKIRLLAINGRPLYVIEPRGGSAVSVWADTGESIQIGVDEAEAIAEEYSGVGVRNITGPIEHDQWVVHQAYDAHRPFFRVSLEDEVGTQIYVSQRSGEVVQHTERAERAWNYVGAIVHWVYPTFLRKNWAVWDQVVWWLSLAGVIVVALGVWLGIDRMRMAYRANKGSLFLFRGWMRWHHILGVFFGLFVFTWILSGWLSMDHGRLLSVPDPQSLQVDKFRGTPLEQAAQSFDVEFIRSLGEFRELRINAVGGEPFLIRRADSDTRIFSSSPPLNNVAILPENLIARATMSTWPDQRVSSLTFVEPDDVYTRLRSSRLPPSAMRSILDDKRKTWVHIDAATGDLISIMDRSRRLNRWLFNGLHSLDFPGFTDKRPLWDIVVVLLMLIGIAFSVTGVRIGYRRLRRVI